MDDASVGQSAFGESAHSSPGIQRMPSHKDCSHQQRIWPSYKNRVRRSKLDTKGKKSFEITVPTDEKTVAADKNWAGRDVSSVAPRSYEGICWALCAASRTRTLCTTRSQRTPINGNALRAFVPTRSTIQPRAIERPRCKRIFTFSSVRSSAWRPSLKCSNLRRLGASLRCGTVPEGQAMPPPATERALFWTRFALGQAKFRRCS